MTNMIYIYIDNDGVINKITQNHSPSQDGWESVIVGKAMGYQIMFAPELIVELKRLSDLPNVEFVILSTWQDEFITHMVPLLGLEDYQWRVLKHDPEFDEDMKNIIGNGWQTTTNNNWWKLIAIQKDIKAHNPAGVVWIDDDIRYERAAVNWVQTLDDILVIVPEQHAGLTKEDIAQIDAFIESFSIDAEESEGVV